MSEYTNEGGALHTATRRKLTAEAATVFESYSVANASILARTAKEKGCKCEAYADWFTYARWHAQGFQVRRGEHSTRLPVYLPAHKTVRDDQTGEERRVEAGKRPWTAHVFCRCQVDRA